MAGSFFFLLPFLRLAASFASSSFSCAAADACTHGAATSASERAVLPQAAAQCASDHKSRNHALCSTQHTRPSTASCGCRVRHIAWCVE